MGLQVPRTAGPVSIVWNSYCISGVPSWEYGVIKTPLTKVK